MSADKTLNELIGRAVIDPDFRRRLFQDPESTVRQEGYQLSQEILERLKDVDVQAAEAAAIQFDEAFAGRSAAG